MTSNDNNLLNINDITLQLRELIATNREQIAEMKAIAAQMQKDNAEFREQMTNNFNTFKNEVRNDLANFKNETNNKFDKIHAEIVALQSDIRVQTTRIDDLIHWNYWLIAFIVALFTLPILGETLKDGIKSLVHGIAAIFKKKDSNDN